MRSNLWVISVGAALAGEARAGVRDFDVTFTGCSELAGVGLVPAANARPLVPAAYTLAGDGVDALVVVRVASCDAISVDGRGPSQGTVSQIGITIVGPDGDADIDNYTLWFATDHGPLHGALRAAGVDSAMDPGLSFDFTGAALDIEASPPQAPEYEVHGSTALPTAAPIPFVARWWAEGRHGVVEMRTDLPEIRFGGAATTLTTPAGSELADLIGDTSLGFPILDSYNTFPDAALSVTVD